MANEITGTVITNIVNSEWIQPAFQDYAHDWLVAARFCKQFNLVGRSTTTVAVPSLASQMGTVSSGGTSVDTEFNASEDVDLSNTAMTLTQATIVSIELGVMRTITDIALEDVVDGFELIAAIAGDNARILSTALEDDVCGLLASFANTAGSTGVDMTLANLDTAIIGIGKRGVRAPDGLVGVLDDEQRENYEAAITALSSSNVNHPVTADRFMAIERDLNNGLTDGRFSVYKGVNLYMTGLTDTVNTAADVAGGIFVPWTAANDSMCALGMAWSRMPLFTTQRDESARSTEVIATLRAGVSELLDVAGVSMITDAP